MHFRWTLKNQKKHANVKTVASWFFKRKTTSSIKIARPDFSCYKKVYPIPYIVVKTRINYLKRFIFCRISKKMTLNEKTKLRNVKNSINTGKIVMIVNEENIYFFIIKKIWNTLMKKTNITTDSLFFRLNRNSFFEFDNPLQRCGIKTLTIKTCCLLIHWCQFKQSIGELGPQIFLA